MKALLFPKIEHQTTSLRVSFALLVLRLFVGIAFILHGSGKIVNATNWMGPDAPVPGILQALAALAEFGGGIALILGLLTPLATLGMIFTMIGAIYFHVSKGDAFVGGYELAAIYLIAAVVVFFTGPGKISVDSVIADKVR